MLNFDQQPNRINIARMLNEVNEDLELIKRVMKVDVMSKPSPNCPNENLQGSTLTGQNINIDEKLKIS